MPEDKKKVNLFTSKKSTWCPMCPNFHILAGVKKFVEDEINSGKKKEDFAMVAGIGCHAKIFDYLDLQGLNTLHGRVPPVCMGLKIGNPNINVLGFSGDGDAYAEGMEHTIHAARYNSNWKYVIHNNQVFSLTIGQPTPTTEVGFKEKTTPLGVKMQPINPIKLMLSAGASFVARVFADVKQIDWVLKEAIKHRGFAFIEVLQPCIIFHEHAMKYKERLYSLEESGHDKTSMEQAMKKADEFDYNNANKIPIGVFYQVERPIFEDGFPQLKNLKNGLKGIKR